MIAVCPSACEFHNRLVRNMLKILAEKNMTLTQKIGIWENVQPGKRFSPISRSRQGRREESFSIPLNRQEMADYLAVDRSALSKELGRLKEGRADIVSQKSSFSC